MINNDIIREKERDMLAMGEAGYRVELPEPVAYLVHRPTHTHINVFIKIGWFRRFMLEKFFGFDYIKLR